MERTVKRKVGYKSKELPFKEVDAIFVSDMHFREDTPVCRTDDFYQAQFIKLRFLSDLQKKYDCPILHPGDFFNHWKPSPELLTKVIREMPDQFYSVFGNHDLPQHNLDLKDKAGLQVLIEAGKVILLESGNWGQIVTEPSIVIKGRKILVQHIFTFDGGIPWPGCTAPGAASLLKKLKEFDTIVTGDNHKPFVVRQGGRLLVNPGSFMRQTADQIDYEPAVWLWNAEKNDVFEVFLPVEKGVITREHLEQGEERDARIEAFISGLDEDWAVELDFVQNLKRFENTNNVRKSVMEIIYEAVGI